MSIARTVAELHAALAPERARGRTIGLVPTMGALHDGHLSLIERAHEECELVVVTLFVNPAQFEDPGDLERYPRDERRDVQLAAGAGAGLLFAPSAQEIYPSGFATSVEVRGPLSERLEGEARGSGHFRGVATVVAKLLCAVQPQAAYFGQKDAQQAALIRRLVADLDLPVRIEVLPIVRERDGVAMSSRNALLSSEERARARALPRALRRACELAAEGERSAWSLCAAAREAMRSLDVEPEYVALVDPASFEPLESLDADALMLLAARIGRVRLIDNATLSVPSGTGAPGSERDAHGAAGERKETSEREVSVCSA